MVKGCPRLAYFCKVFVGTEKFEAQIHKDREYLKRLVKQFELEAEEKTRKKKI